jgi:hypothetical protein
MTEFNYKNTPGKNVTLKVFYLISAKNRYIELGFIDLEVSILNLFRNMQVVMLILNMMKHIKCIHIEK